MSKNIIQIKATQLLNARRTHIVQIALTTIRFVHFTKYLSDMFYSFSLILSAAMITVSTRPVKFESNMKKKN